MFINRAYFCPLVHHLYDIGPNRPDYYFFYAKIGFYNYVIFFYHSNIYSSDHTSSKFTIDLSGLFELRGHMGWGVPETLARKVHFHFTNVKQSNPFCTKNKHGGPPLPPPSIFRPFCLTMAVKPLAALESEHFMTSFHGL